MTVLSFHIIVNKSALLPSRWYDVELERGWKTERGKPEDGPMMKDNPLRISDSYYQMISGIF